MTQLNDQENKQVELGVAAAALMENAFFGFVMTEMANAYVNGIVTSKPDQTKEREGFYASIKALEDVGGTLTHWVQVKDQIMANAETNEQAE